jgi:NAD(P)-dependent dehydrogenase (short-subunit alcohol dehydrogenase family)
MTESPLSGRIAVVTGASRGIGYEAALALAKAGAHVVAIARTQGGLEELDDAARSASGQRMTLVPLDLAEGDAIDQLGGLLNERFGRIDILVHAGGTLGSLTPVSHADPKMWDRTLAVNLTSAYRLIRSFEPLLRKSDAARAIFLTSGAASRPKAFWGVYAASKAGLEALVRAWADEVESAGVNAVILDPGRMRTRMRAEAYPGEDPMTLPPPSEIGPLVVELAAGERTLPVELVSFSAWAAGRANARS